MKYNLMSPLQRNRFDLKDFFWVLALFLMQITLYGTGIFNGFVGDDRTYFLDNDLYNNLSYKDFFKFFAIKTNYWGEHLPVRDYLNLIQKNEFLTNPFPYHLVSFFIFSLFILVVYKIFRLLDSESENAKFVGFISTAFYISHPALVECVSYVSGQKDLLCGIFTALTIITLIKYLQKNTYYFLFCSSLFYYFALFSKSVAIVNFLAIIVIYYFFNKNKRCFRDLIIWIVFNLPAFWWIFYSIGVGTGGAKIDNSLLNQLINAIKIIGWQIYITVKIYPRSFGYPFVENEIDVYLFLGLFLCLLFLTAFIFTENKFIKVGILFWFIFLIPVLRIFHSASNAGVYDRYLFLPLFGLSIIVYGIFKQYSSKYILLAVVSIISINSVFTILSISNFKNDIASAANSYRAYPQWNRTSFDYAYALIEGGKLEEAELLLEKEKAFQKPTWVIPYFRGWIALERGDLSSAEEILRIAAMHAATGGFYPFPNIPLARTMLQAGKIDAAKIVLQRVLVLGGKANPLEYFKAKSLLPP